MYDGVIIEDEIESVCEGRTVECLPAMSNEHGCREGDLEHSRQWRFEYVPDDGDLQHSWRRTISGGHWSWRHSPFCISQNIATP